MATSRGMGKIRKRPLSFAVFYIVATIISFGIMTIRPTTVAADGNTALLNAARAWIGYNFIASHVRDGDVSDGLSQEEVDKMSYFASAGSMWNCMNENVGYLLGQTNGRLQRDPGGLYLCFEDNTTDKAYDAVLGGIGYDRSSFITSLGFKKDSSGLYKGGSMSVDSMNKSLQAKWPSQVRMPSVGDGTPAMWIQYLDLVAGLQGAHCTGAGLFEFPSPPATNGTIITLVDPQGKVGQYSVEAKKGDLQVAVGGKISCQDGVNRLKDGDGEKAKEYASILSKFAEATAQDCKDKYTTPEEQDACTKGKENKDNAEYCTTDYASKPALQDACKYGQQYAKDTAISNTTTESAKEEKTCVIDGVGWIVCPVAKFVASIVDGIFKYMIEPMIVTPPVDTTTNGGKSLQQAWSVMRNIANVAFIIAFIIVIYSQITSAGISNYGIKRMLPRLIIGAIFLNTSFWICAIAVDVSNIVGSSLNNILMGIFNDTMKGSSWEAVIGVLLAGGVGASAIAAGSAAVIALGAGPTFLMAGLWIALPLLIGALLAVITAGIVLALRQALIVVLIVISPLAIAAYLLPNTQQWFDKWRKLFTTMLVFYPLFAIIFGGSQVAAGILLAASTGQTSNGNPTGFILLLTAMVAQVFPLFSAPFVMKFSGGVLGNIGAKFQGGLGKLTAPLNKYARNQAGKNATLGKTRAFNGAGALAGRDVGRIRGRFTRGVGRTLQGISTRGQRLDMQLENAKAEGEAVAAQRVAEDSSLSGLDIHTRAMKERASGSQYTQTQQYHEAVESSEDLQNLAGETRANGQQRVASIAHSAQVKAFNENMEIERSTMKTMDGAALQSIMEDTSASAERRAAAASQLSKSSSDADIHKALDYLGAAAANPGSAEEAGKIRDMQQQMAADLGSRKPSAMGAGDAAALARGEFKNNMESMIRSRISSGKMSAEGLAAMSPDEIQRFEKHVKDYKDGVANGQPADAAFETALATLQSQVKDYRTNPQMQGRQPNAEISGHMDRISNY